MTRWYVLGALVWLVLLWLLWTTSGCSTATPC